MEALVWVLAVFVWLVVGFLFGTTFFSGAKREETVPEQRAAIKRRAA